MFSANDLRALGLRRWLANFALIVACAIGLFPPLVFFYAGLSATKATMKVEAEINARLMNELINHNPLNWVLEEERLESLLRRRPEDKTAEIRRIVDLQGNEVAEVADELLPIQVTERVAVRDSGETVGYLEIYRSISWLILGSLFLLLGFVLFSFAVYRFLLRAPTRQLLLALHEVEAAREAVLVAEKERLATEKELHRAETMARLSSQFLANMSHELRTPLNGIIGMVDLVLMGEVDKDQKENLNFALQSAHQLNNIVNDIMELAQIDSRVSMDHSAPFSLAHMLSQVIEEYDFVAFEKNINLKKNIVGHLPEFVMGDQPKIRRIFSILIGNAVKFTHEGEVAVSVLFDFDHSILNLDVIDTGVGISKEHQEMIFEPFVQADSTMTRRFGGVGLGLTICSRLVNLLGGEISLNSELGKGTSFSLRVPVSGFNSIG